MPSDMSRQAIEALAADSRDETMRDVAHALIEAQDELTLSCQSVERGAAMVRDQEQRIAALTVELEETKRAGLAVSLLAGRTAGQLAGAKGEIEALTAELALAKQRNNSWEEREGSCCPEDVGFEEYIAELAHEREQLQQASACDASELTHFRIELAQAQEREAKLRTACAGLPADMDSCAAALMRCAQYGHAEGLRERRAMLVAALAAAMEKL